MTDSLALDLKIVRHWLTGGHLHDAVTLAFECGCLAYAHVTRARDAAPPLKGPPPVRCPFGTPSFSPMVLVSWSGDVSQSEPEAPSRAPEGPGEVERHPARRPSGRK